MEHDLFISYAREDDKNGFVSAFVECIKGDFRQFTGRELTEFFDARDIRAMDDWNRRLVEGLRESRLFVAFLSPNYAASDYCRKEFAWWAQHEMHRYVLGDGVAPIYTVTVLGFPDEQHGEPWLKRMSAYQHYDVRSFFNEGIHALKEAAVADKLSELRHSVAERLDRRVLAENAPASQGFPNYNKNFVGRREELRNLRDALVQESRSAVTTALQGFGGVGKSELAFTYAHAFAWDYQVGRFYIPCDGMHSLHEAISRVGDYLQIAFSENEQRHEDLKTARVIDKIRRRAKKLSSDQIKHAHALIVLDNVSDGQLLSKQTFDLLPNEIHVIATTRLDPHTYGDIRTQTIDFLHDNDALALLEGMRNFATEDEEAAAREIVGILGGFTLAVEVVGSYLRAHEGESYREYLEELRAMGIEALDRTGSDKGVDVARNAEKQVGALLRKSFETLLSDRERAVLRWASILPPDAIALPWLRTFAGKDDPDLLKDGGLGNPWKRTLEHLTGLRFVTQTDDPNIARMHRLVRDAVPVNAEKNSAMQEVFSSYVWECLNQPLDHWFTGSTGWELTTLRAVASELFSIEQTGTLPTSWPMRDLTVIANRLGGIFLDFGDIAEAQRQFEEGLRISRLVSESQPDSVEAQRDLSISYNKLGEVALQQNDVVSARAYFEYDLKISLQLSERQPDSVEAQRDVSISYERLGDAALRQNDTVSARAYFDDSLKIRRMLFENQPDSVQAQRDLSVSYNKLGDVALQQNDVFSARAYFEDGLKISRLLAERKPESVQAQRDLSISYNWLGNVALQQNDAVSARAYFKDYLKISHLLAERQPESVQAQRDLAISYNKLGETALLQNDTVSARAYFDDSLKIRRMLSESQPDSVQAQRDLAVSYERLGGVALQQNNTVSARAYFDDSLKIRRVLSESHPDSVQAQRDLAVSFAKLASLNQSLKDNSLFAEFGQRYIRQVETMRKRGMFLDESLVNYEQWLKEHL